MFNLHHELDSIINTLKLTSIELRSKYSTYFFL